MLIEAVVRLKRPVYAMCMGLEIVLRRSFEVSARIGTSRIM